MKTIVVYYSLTSNNELLAFHLQSKLNADIRRIETSRKYSKLAIFFDKLFGREVKLKPYSVDLRSYDHVVFVAPIWAGLPATPLLSFIRGERASLKRYSFATICGGQDGQKEKVNNELTSIVQFKPEVVMDLRINDLLPAPTKGDVRYAINYRITPTDLQSVANSINQFVSAVEEERTLAKTV